MSEFPEIIPIFPLYGTILLPNTILPLHIFEPRYQQMIEYAMKHDQVIGIVQPIEQEQEKIYKIGCLGKIEQCQQLPNENYLIRLNGVLRFQIEKELEVTTKYRKVVSDYSNFVSDLEEGDQDLEDPELLYEKFCNYAEKKNIQIEWDKLRTIPIHYLVNILCMNLDFNSTEKQALLETRNFQHRWDTLITLISMAIADNTDQPSANECVN
tara:strand:- start:1089 stop:1721 length:633 start_codon:yes stop_codon:yes gene_type:complete